MTWPDNASTSFPMRQRYWNAWVVTSTDGGATWDADATPADFFTGNLSNPLVSNLRGSLGTGNANVSTRFRP